MVIQKIPCEQEVAGFISAPGFKDLHSYITEVTSDNVHAGEVISNFKY